MTISNDKYIPPHKRLDRPIFDREQKDSDHSRIARASITSYDKFSQLQRSKNDQSKVSLNFNLLRSAEPSPDNDFLQYNSKSIRSSDLVEMNPDEVFEMVNFFAKQRRFLPLRCCGHILKKYSNGRLGTLDEARTFYQIILKKYANSVFKLENRDARNVHSEMILVLGRRNDPNEDPAQLEVEMREIYENYQHTYTINSLLAAFNAMSLYEKTKELYAQWPALKKDKWTYVGYLTAIKENSDDETLKSEYNKILDVYKKGLPFFYIRNICKNSDQAQEYINSGKANAYIKDISTGEDLSTGKPKTETYQGLLWHYLKDKKYECAKSAFDNSPVPRDMSLYLTMIKGMVDYNLNYAVALYDNLLNLESYKVIGNEKNDRNGTAYIRKNFHCIYSKKGGSPAYYPLSLKVIQVALHHLKTVELPKMQQDYRAQITLITGKGKKYSLRTAVFAFVQNEMNWPVSIRDEDAGDVVVKGQIGQLVKSKNTWINRDETEGSWRE